MGDKGAGSGTGSYDYFGTLLAAVCAGPVDLLHGVLIDGKSVVDCYPPLARGVGPDVDLTSLVIDKYLLSGGKMVLFWGTDSQDISVSFPSFAHHPDYRGICVLGTSGLLFGRERTSAPNIEVIVSRKPVVSTDLVGATENTIEDGQVNPVAVLAELLTGWHGLGLPVASLHASDWLAAAEACAANPARFYCSPMLTSQSDVRGSALKLLEVFDGVLYWTAAGKLGIRLLSPGTNPGGLATLDSLVFTERPRIDGNGWPDVPTKVLVRYPDRDAQYKDREASGTNLMAQRARGLSKTLTVESPFVTRQAQAALIAAEQIKRTARPAGTLTLTVRRPRAVGLVPGTKVLADIDPEPGGAGLAQMAVVRDRTEDAAGPVRLTLIPDTLVESVPYHPELPSGTPQAPDCPGIVAADCLAVPLAPQATGYSVGLCVPRPSGEVVGFRVFFAVDTDADTDLDDEDWADLGIQTGFAVRMTLEEDVADDETAIDLTLTAGADGPDAYLAARLPDNPRDAEQDTLLLVLANVDGNGAIVVTGGLPELELCSVVTRVAVDGDTHTYTVLRARRGTAARAWTTSASPMAFIVPLANIPGWTHPRMANIADGGTGYFRLVAYSAATEDDGVRPQVQFTHPSGYNPSPVIAWTAPGDGTPDFGQGVANPATGSYTPDVDVTDAQGDLVSVQITSRKTDGSGFTSHVDQTFALTASWAFNSAITFGSYGSFLLTVTATDKAGNVASSTRTVSRTAAGGLTPPRLDPPDGTFVDHVSVTITAESPADQVQWAVTSIGASEPTSWSETTVGDLDRVVTVTSAKRIWARAKKSSDGSTSTASFGDYEPADW